MATSRRSRKRVLQFQSPHIQGTIPVFLVNDPSKTEVIFEVDLMVDGISPKLPLEARGTDPQKLMEEAKAWIDNYLALTWESCIALISGFTGDRTDSSPGHRDRTFIFRTALVERAIDAKTGDLWWRDFGCTEQRRATPIEGYATKGITVLVSNPQLSAGIGRLSNMFDDFIGEYLGDMVRSPDALQGFLNRLAEADASIHFGLVTKAK